MSDSVSDECKFCGAAFSGSFEFGSTAESLHWQFLEAHEQCRRQGELERNGIEEKSPREEVWLEGYRKGVEDTLSGHQESFPTVPPPDRV